MPFEVKLPAMSPTMEEGTLARWLKAEGDAVKPGDVLAEIETDKATMELEADEGGTLARILVQGGSDGVKVGTTIAVIALEGDDAPRSSGEAPVPRPHAGEGGAHSEPGDGGSSPTQNTAPTSPPPVDKTAAQPFAPATRGAPPTKAPEEASTNQASARQSPTGAAPASLQVTPAVPAGTETIRQTVREALRDAMAEEMRRDPTVFVMGEEVAEYQGAYKVTQNLLQEFGPKRVIDTPITEYGFAGLGVGAAMGGLKPVVEFMTFNFALQAIDHIINSAAKTNYMSGGQMRTPIVFRGPNGAASRVAAQHSQNFAPWYASVPGLIVIAPYSAADAKGLLKAAIRTADPVVFLENELLYGQTFDVPKLDDFVLPIGKARVVRPGRDVTIVSYTIGVGVALDAATKLAAEGIEAEVIDLRTLRPLDRETVIESLKKTNRMVVVEEGFLVCSIASELAMVAMEDGFDHLDAPVARVTNADVPLPYAANLEKAALIKVDDVVKAVKTVCYR
ncbi:MAG: pyruvate dehydrogenase complex E1 component subunit beta [Sphingomonadaceae bacterium]|nr:pyruvate dehydrogenase complex E1 component subunit beta [Sphingomonadaceae bacterium]